MKNDKRNITQMRTNARTLLIVNILAGLCFLCIFSLSTSAFPKGFSCHNLKTDTARQHWVVEYYPNGKIKAKGYQGLYENAEISTEFYLGTWQYFNTDGSLDYLIYYHNDLPAKAYIIKTTYHRNGKTKSVERYNNYDLYQTEVKKIGRWKYFDQEGRMIKTVQY